MFGRATIRLGIGIHSSFVSSPCLTVLHDISVLALVVAAGIGELSSTEWCTSPRQ